MKCMYTIVVSKSISPVGLGKWYQDKYDVSYVGTPVNNDGLWSIDVEVNQDDCDRIEAGLSNDARVRSFAAKE